MMEDTPMSVYVVGWNVAPITRPGIQMAGTHMQEHIYYNQHCTEQYHFWFGLHLKIVSFC